MVLPMVLAQDTTYVLFTNPDGTKVRLLENRQPALYTQSFGDCLGGSLLEVSRFDAAYYQDNMTVAFHMQGEAQVTNQTLMRTLSLDSSFGMHYWTNASKCTSASMRTEKSGSRRSSIHVMPTSTGERAYDEVPKECEVTPEFSLCPTNTSIPVEAAGLIPVSEEDVSGIPPIALAIPDFEGQAMLRIFANATKSEIACFSAIITNGNTMSHSAVVGIALGIVTFMAMIASFATAIYGQHMPTIRNHYAHSLSIFVVFAVHHHVFFTGALSMNWPSVLSSWWSNFAWTAGMIYTPSMQSSINHFLGSNMGNTSVVGAANLGSSSDNTAGGYRISQIYRRGPNAFFGRKPAMFADVVEMVERNQNAHLSLTKRSLKNATTGFFWYGNPVQPGLPLPGNFTGFAGTLSSQGIPASNAFMTGFLWFLILIVIIAGLVTIFKWSLEGMAKQSWIKHDRLALFRENWIGFAALAVARTFFIAFFVMMFLTLFQFVYKGPAGVTVIAVLVFLVFFVGLLGISGLSCFYRLRNGSFARKPDRLHFEVRKVFHVIPWLRLVRESKRKENSNRSIGSLPWLQITYTSEDPQRVDVHQDEPYMIRYGWLNARFRKSKWWFASFWIVYEFVRACFFGGAAGHPLAQVFGLLVLEFICLIAIIKMRPFEGTRLNTMMVYLLGLSKVLTVALSSAFHPLFGVARITATAVAFIIIIIQGLLLIVLMIFIAIGIVSSYMSLTRNREDFHPHSWHRVRERYLDHVEKASLDEKQPALEPKPVHEPQPPKSPYFAVNSIRRIPRFGEDEDDEHIDPHGSQMSLGDHNTPPAGPTNRSSRALSMLSNYSRNNLSYSNLPYGARPHRASWTSRDFVGLNHDGSRRNSVPMSPVNNAAVPPPPLPEETTAVHRDSTRSNSIVRESYDVRPLSSAPSYGVSGVLEVRKSRPEDGRWPIEDAIEPAPPATNENAGDEARKAQKRMELD